MLETRKAYNDLKSDPNVNPGELLEAQIEMNNAQTKWTSGYTDYINKVDSAGTQFIENISSYYSAFIQYE